jgi:hypothetical protein
MNKTVQLGELLSLGQTSSADLQAWLAAEDEALAQRLCREAEARGESAAQFLRIAVSDFLAEATEESWADLVSALRNARDPGAACVAKVTAFRVRMESAP